MILNAEDLTIQAINPAYKQLLGERNVNGLSMTLVFTGRQVDDLIQTVKTAVDVLHTVNTGPIMASVNGEHYSDSARFIHTILPISDPSGSTVTRLFLYSERVE